MHAKNKGITLVGNPEYPKKKKNPTMKITIIGLFFFICCSSANAQISGTVFRDFNNNGVKNNTATFNEPFVAGVTVKAFNAANVQLGVTKTTDAAGAYSFTALEIPSGIAVRIEFSGLSVADASSFNGTGNGTNVQFATGAQVPTVNFAINNPADYNEALPKFVMPLYSVGTAGGANAGKPALITLNYDYTGRTTVATHAQIGATYGVGYQKTTQYIYSSAFLKRNVGLAQGLGHIFMTHAATGFKGSFTLQGVNGIDMGTVDRATAPDNTINTTDVFARDLDAFGKVGTVGFGDAEVYNNKILSVVNLKTRSLINIDISNISLLPTNGSAVPASLVTEYPLTFPGACAATSGVMRPFGLAYYKDKGYIGVVCDASVSKLASDLTAFVYSFDPLNVAGGLTLVVSFPLNYTREKKGYFSAGDEQNGMWKPWVNVWADMQKHIYSGTEWYPDHASPVLAGIEFSEDGSMILGFMDRVANQIGQKEPIPLAGAPASNIIQDWAAGDIIKLCNVGGSYVMEASAASCTDADNISAPAAMMSLVDGPSNVGEFFFNDTYLVGSPGTKGHGETSLGSLGYKKGSYEVLLSCFDFNAYDQPAALRKFNVNNGAKNSEFLITGAPGGSTSRFGKQQGIGDIELLSAEQPIQIGNRIWQDTNFNGIQDADETTPGVPMGTIVTLRSPGVDGIYGNGDDQTWVTTTDATGNYFFSSLSGSDNRKPASWTGVGNTILPGYNYRIEVAIPSLNSLTVADAGGPAGDHIDNDAVTSGSTAIVNFNTSNTNHNFDIGIAPIPLPLTLVSFTAQLKGGNVVDLKWETAAEINVSHFEIEKSMDGVNFTKLSIVSAQGNTADITHYSINDIVNTNQSLLYYYRLRSVDKDGKSELSATRMIRISKQAEKATIITTYPNPVNNEIRITIPGNWQNKKGVYEIYDAIGKTVKRMEVSSSSQTETINISSLSPGFYIVQVSFNGQSAQQKILKR